MQRLIVVVGVIAATALSWVDEVEAADTTETWDVGATDVDFYLGLDGVGRDKYDKIAYSDIMLGYGIIDRFSSYLGATLQGNEVLSDGAATLYLGVFGTPIDTAHVDLDLRFEFSVGGAGFDQLRVTPGIELNLDADPEMRSVGLYGRASVPLYGRHVSPATTTATVEPAHELALLVESTIGGYYTVADGHQLLLEYDMTFAPAPEPDARGVDVGGLALGYNVALNDTIELITQIYLDLPQAGERTTVGVMAGFIATLPGAGARGPSLARGAAAPTCTASN